MQDCVRMKSENPIFLTLKWLEFSLFNDFR